MPARVIGDARERGRPRDVCDGLLLIWLQPPEMGANLMMRAGIDAGGGFAPQAAGVVLEFVRLLPQPLFLSGFLYFLASLVWLRVVASEPLSVAYPVLVSLTFTLVTGGAVLFSMKHYRARKCRAGGDSAQGSCLYPWKRGQRDQDRDHRLRLLGSEPGAEFRRDPRRFGCEGRRSRSPKAGSVQRRYPAIATTTDFMELIRDPNVDAVAIATPVGTHFELAMAALKAGQARVGRKTDDRDFATGAQAGRRSGQTQAGAVRRSHFHLYRRRAQDGEKSSRQRRPRENLLLRFDSRQSRTVPARRERRFRISRCTISPSSTTCWASIRGGLGERHHALPRHPENLAYITLFYDSGTIAHANVNWSRR